MLQVTINRPLTRTRVDFQICRNQEHTIFTEEAEQIYYRRIAPVEAADLKPERSYGANFDLNYLTPLSDKSTFSINQLFYITRLKNSLVLRDFSANELSGFENADEDLLGLGFETNIKVTYLDFVLYSNYAFVNTRFLYENVNQQYPLTPSHNLGMVLMYEKEGEWSVGYELYFTGSQYDNNYDKKPSYWVMGFMLMRMFKNLSIYVNFENFTNTIQSDFEPLVIPSASYPDFRDIWAPVEGFVGNAGLKYRIL